MITTKPEDFKETGKQICMRCGKVEAVTDDIFCEGCIAERKRMDDLFKEQNKGKISDSPDKLKDRGKSEVGW